MVKSTLQICKRNKVNLNYLCDKIFRIKLISKRKDNIEYNIGGIS